MWISGPLHSDSYSEWNIDRKTLDSIYLPYDSLPMLQLHAELKATSEQGNLYMSHHTRYYRV